MNNNDLKKESITNTVWKFMERILAQGIAFIVSIVLARILLPEEYSVVGIVTIFFTFANLLISSGLNTALIQKKNVDNRDFSTVLSISLIISIIIYFVLFMCAVPLSELYKQSILVPMIRVMGLTLPINAVKSIYCAKISIDLSFKKFFFATIGGTIVSGIAGIIAAFNGLGAWALVLQQMLNIIVGTLILIALVPMKLELYIDKERGRGLFKYGWKILASSFIGALYTELNPLIIGFKFTAADLSFYTKGRSFPGLVTSVSTNTLASVLFPVLSKNQDDKETLERYTRLYVRLASYITFPLMIGLAIIADDFVVLLLTEKWLPATPYMRIFCIAYMFDMVHIGNCETIKAMGRSDIYLKVEIIKKTCYFAIISIFLLFADNPLVLSVSYIICTLVALLVNSIPNIFLLGYTFLKQVQDIVPSLCCSIIMGGIVALVDKIDINTILSIFVQIIIGVVTYIVLSVLTKNKSFIYIMQTVKDYRKETNYEKSIGK